MLNEVLTDLWDDNIRLVLQLIEDVHNLSCTVTCVRGSRGCQYAEGESSGWDDVCEKLHGKECVIEHLED